MVDNDVTVRYLLRDDATGGLKRIEGQAERTGAALRSNAAAGNPLLTLFDALDGKTGNLTRQWDALDRRLMSTSRTMNHDLLIGVRNLTGGLLAAAGAATFFGLKAVNSFQHTQAAFSVLTGSMANGQQLYNQLMQLNLQSPFDMQPLAQSEQTLLGFGFNQRNSLPLLQNISNVAAVQQDPNDALMRMSLAVGQINQSGTVRAQDLNQLVQAGLPAYKLIPGGKAGLLDGSGRISSDQFIAALSNANNPTLRPYGGAASAMNKTISGQLSNLTTLVKQEAIKAFAPLGDELVKEMPHLTTVLQGEVRNLAPALGDVGADMIKGVEELLPVLDPIVKALLSGLHELAQVGAPFFDALAAQDPEITAALDDFFSTLAGEAPELSALFVGLVQLLPPFLHALDDAITLVDPVIKLADGLLSLGPVRTIVGDLLVGLLAYRTLGPAIKAVLGMRDAMIGLAGAEEAVAVAGGGGGGKLPLTGTSTYRGGKRVGTGGRGVGLGGLSAVLGLFFASNRNDEKTAYLDAHPEIAASFGGHVRPSLTSSGYLSRGPRWADAIQNDARLSRMIQRYDASINLATGAIVVHGAKDPDATAKAIVAEIERYENKRAERQ